MASALLSIIATKEGYTEKERSPRLSTKFGLGVENERGLGGKGRSNLSGETKFLGANAYVENEFFLYS